MVALAPAVSQFDKRSWVLTRYFTAGKSWAKRVDAGWVRAWYTAGLPGVSNDVRVALGVDVVEIAAAGVDRPEVAVVQVHRPVVADDREVKVERPERRQFRGFPTV